MIFACWTERLIFCCLLVSSRIQEDGSDSRGIYQDVRQETGCYWWWRWVQESSTLAAGHPNITLLGYQRFWCLWNHICSKLKPLFLLPEEDFGITPVEAQACGTPVIAFGKGGALETVRPLGVNAQLAYFLTHGTVYRFVLLLNHLKKISICCFCWLPN